MASKQSISSGYVIAGILFPTLTVLGIRYIFANSVLASGLANDLATKCTAPGSPYLHQFSKINFVDQYVCKLVALFHAVLEPEPILLLQYFSTAGVLSAFMSVEANRRDRPTILAFPMTIAFLGQFITFGLSGTIYWALFLWSGAASRTSGFHSQITQADAEGIIFASVVGATIPSIAFNVLKNPTVTALWQIFPVYAALLHLAYTLVRKPSNHPQSGFKTIRVYYIVSFLFAASEHIRLLGLFNLSAFAAAFTPSMSPLPLTASLAAKVDEFLKWDFVFVFGPSILTTLWFARDVVEAVKIAAWHAAAVPIVGPGASLTAVFIWRETMLNGAGDEVPSSTKGKTT